MKKLLLILLSFISYQAFACTILSGTDAKGHTWVCNNEDWSAFSFHNYINVFPKEANAKFGYITWSYGSPDGYIQGGVNEAGLFFDFNGLPPQEYTLKKGKKPFPGGDYGTQTNRTILRYMMQNLKTVPEFLELLKVYYIPNLQSQIHLADAAGNFAMITPDSIIVQTRKYQVSTNFSLSEPDPAKKICWRYPVADGILQQKGISKESLLKAAAASSWRNNFVNTFYTNQHNLNTGDMWFYFGEDFTNSWKANIHQLLKKGKHSIRISSLFPSHNSVRLHKLIEGGADEKQLTAFLNSEKFTDIEKEAMLRHCYFAYLLMDHQIAKADLVYNHWKKYVAANPRNDLVNQHFVDARHAAFLGNYDEALKLLARFHDAVKHAEINKQPLFKPEIVEPVVLAKARQLKHNLQFKEPEGESVRLVLKHHREAKSVYVQLVNSGRYHFMKKEGDEWVAYVPKDKELIYAFYVNDTKILDPGNSRKKIAEDMSGRLEEFSVK